MLYGLNILIYFIGSLSKDFIVWSKVHIYCQFTYSTVEKTTCSLTFNLRLWGQNSLIFNRQITEEEKVWFVVVMIQEDEHEDPSMKDSIDKNQMDTDIPGTKIY